MFLHHSLLYKWLGYVDPIAMFPSFARLLTHELHHAWHTLHTHTQLLVVVEFYEEALCLIRSLSK